MSALLAAGLRGTPDGIRAAHEAGRRYGASLVTEPADSPESVLGQLAPLGAEYRLAGSVEVLAENCIFRQACEGAEEVVCELHAGILEGAFQGAGLALRIEPFSDFAEKGCAYQVLTSKRDE